MTTSAREFADELDTARARIAALEQTILANVVDGAAIDATVIKNSVLTALRAQVAELEQDVDVAHGCLQLSGEYVHTLQQQVATLTAERDDAVDKREGPYMSMDELKRQLATLTAERDQWQASQVQTVQRLIP